MKPRSVMLIIESETDIPFKDLRDKKNIRLQVYTMNGLSLRDVKINQIQVDVVKTKRKGRK